MECVWYGEESFQFIMMTNVKGSWNVLVYEKATLALLSLISSWVNLWFQNFDKNILKLSAFLLFLQIHAKQKSGKTI